MRNLLHGHDMITHIGNDRDLVFADSDGEKWKMGRIWHTRMLPLIAQLKEEGLGM